MFRIAKVGGIWQIWNVTCDGSIIVENGHRNMGFFERSAGKKAKILTSLLRPVNPVFSLSTNPLGIIFDLDLARAPNGFHVFDYTQLQKAGIDINDYVQINDFRLGSFVVSKGIIFAAERIADELDAYPGRPFLVRDLEGQIKTFKLAIPSRKEAKIKLLEIVQETMGGQSEQQNQHELEEQIRDYIETFCYPDLDLKIFFLYHGESRSET
jgi:hypothetical protein